VSCIRESVTENVRSVLAKTPALAAQITQFHQTGSVSATLDSLAPAVRSYQGMAVTMLAKQRPVEGPTPPTVFDALLMRTGMMEAVSALMTGVLLMVAHCIAGIVLRSVMVAATLQPPVMPVSPMLIGTKLGSAHVLMTGQVMLAMSIEENAWSSAAPVQAQHLQTVWRVLPMLNRRMESVGVVLAGQGRTVRCIPEGVRPCALAVLARAWTSASSVYQMPFVGQLMIYTMASVSARMTGIL
jgi:hypothetical protein